MPSRASALRPQKERARRSSDCDDLEANDSPERQPQRSGQTLGSGNGKVDFLRSSRPLEQAMNSRSCRSSSRVGPSGIGHQAALALAAEGANILVADFNLEGATKVASELTQKDVEAFPFTVDLSKAAEVEAMVDFAVEKLGTLNGIFNNADIGLVKPFLEMNIHHRHGLAQTMPVVLGLHALHAGRERVPPRRRHARACLCVSPQSGARAALPYS
jgi:hypothetical protein